jgi:hypothetical protein
MRSINELISIVKRISPEGIKPSELLRLKDWTDKNRNLVCDSNQAETIELLERVIENGTIDKLVKEKIINKASSFVKGNSPYIDALFDLYVAIDQFGNDLNRCDEEIRFFVWWRDQKGDDFNYSRCDERLDEIINNIIDNKVLSEEDQKYALKRVDDWIQIDLFEAKIKHLCKLVRRRKNIGPELIEILDDESVITYILDMGEGELDCYLDPNALYRYDVDEIVVVSLTLIAMLNYDNGNYYSHVRRVYAGLYKYYSEQRIEGTIRSILSEYRRKGESATRTRIINVVLENALVPQAYLPAFFEFIFDIYKLNFDYDLPENLYDEFKFVFEGLRSTILLDGDDISINATHKTYKLIASTKSLITTDDGVDALIKLSIMVVRLIDRRFWDKEIKIFNPYLKAGFEGWEKQLISTTTGEKDQKLFSNDFRSRWEPKFSYTRSGICLISPVHRIKAQYDYKKIAIEVLNDGVLLVRKEDCYIKEIIGGYEVSAVRILINNPLGKLTYRVTVGDEILYDSKDKLYREFIVFDANCNEISNNTDYQGTAYICYKPNEANIDCIEAREHYWWGYKLIRGGEAIAIGHDVFNFSSMIKPGIFGKVHEKCRVLELKSGEMLEVYSTVNALVFEVDNATRTCEVLINGKPHKLSEMTCKRTDRGSITKYVVDLELIESGIYEVEVSQLFDGKCKRIFARRFVIDNKLIYTVNIIDDGRSGINVMSGFLQESLATEITAETFDPSFLRFLYNGMEYVYYLPLNLGYYSLDDSNWNAKNEDMWIDDVALDATLKLFDAECNSVKIFDENAVLIEDNIAIQDQGSFRTVAIGFLNSYKTFNKFITLIFKVNDYPKYTIRCYNKCIMDEDLTKIEFLDNPPRVLVTPYFHGKNKVSFEIYNSAGERVNASKLLESGQTTQVEGLNSFEEYTFNFHEKTKVLRLRKDTLLYSERKTFYAKQDFVGCAFKIDTIYYSKYQEKGESQEIERHLHFAYVQIIEMRDDGILIGNIFIKTFRGEWQLNNINPVEVEICSEIIDDTMDAYITNYGDGLLYDERKHGILNSIVNSWAPDIFLYTLNLKGERVK